MIMLSVKAGLRAGEITQLTWSMVTDSNGDIGQFIQLPGAIANNSPVRPLALLWQIYWIEFTPAVRTSHRRRLCDCVEDFLPDGGKAWLRGRSYLSFFPL